MTKLETVLTKKSIDSCYLVFEDGYLRCLCNHQVGEECLRDQEYKDND